MKAPTSPQSTDNRIVKGWMKDSDMAAMIR